MRMIYTILLTTSVTPAFAHGGHVGELAGHAHWIGLAAALGAGAIAAALLKGKKSEQENSDDVNAEEAEEEGETA